jgi:hypothetical protein
MEQLGGVAGATSQTGTGHRRRGARRRPPLVEGVPLAGPRDAWRLTRWSLSGHVHEVRRRRSTTAQRVYSAALVALWWPFLPVTVPILALAMSRPWARYYLTPERDAVLAVVATRREWMIIDHISARPGTGRGRVLRRLVLPVVVQAADAKGVAIGTTAASVGLAAAYAADVPGLVDVGPGRPRGRRMRREATAAERERT